MSPSDSSAPGTSTGRNSVEPVRICITSRLPPSSRGGIVRTPVEAYGSCVGAAPSAVGGRASMAASRSVQWARRSAEGATPITPMKASSGIVIPGRRPLEAAPLCRPQVTRYGSGKRSASSPKPGITGVEPNVSVRTSMMSTCSTSPGSAPSTKMGPVIGWGRLRSIASRSASTLVTTTWPSSPSRQSTRISSPSATTSAGSRSGCQRLCPVSGASASERRIGGARWCSAISVSTPRGGRRRRGRERPRRRSRYAATSGRARLGGR